MFTHELLSRSARLYGKYPSVVDGEVRLTYGQLDARVTSLAIALQGLGLEEGDHVAILALNGFRYLEVFLATARAGLVLAPINTRLSPSETAFILNDGEIKALVVGLDFLPLLEKIRGELKTLKQVVLIDGESQDGLHGYEALLAGAGPAALRQRNWREDDMAYLCYTGGTTGLPKGVMLSHRNVVSNALHTIQYAELSERDIWLHSCPAFHAADTWSNIAFTALGALHIFIDRFDPKRVMELIQEHHITTILMVPTMINMVLDLPDLLSYDFSSLRRIIFGASPMPVERLKQAIGVFGPMLQHVYGQTETSPFLTSTPMRTVKVEGTEEEVRRLASCGQELLGCEVKVVNQEGAPVQPGEVGEIIARGPNIMIGYWNRPEETAQAFSDGWVRTGDLAMVDSEAFIFLVDRAKDLIITGGENVYSTEVENVIYQHTAVQEAAVIAVPDPEWGEAVKAVVVVRPGHTLTAGELIGHCRERIAAYKCPRTVDFLEILPKSGAGKILKTELRKPFWEGHTRAVN